MGPPAHHHLRHVCTAPPAPQLSPSALILPARFTATAHTHSGQWLGARAPYDEVAQGHTGIRFNRACPSPLAVQVLAIFLSRRRHSTQSHQPPTTPHHARHLYRQNLLEYDWKKDKGPGGHFQWSPVRKDPASTEPLPDIMMLTTDVALLHDTDYLKLVKLYASDLGALERSFSHAWYKLVTRDMGPITRCLGDQVPPPQPFQAPLPPPPARKPDYNAVKRAIQKALRTSSKALSGDTVRGKPYYGALFATLAWQCASSFRKTDYAGGCNGARIRFAPQKDWPQNKGMDR
jgi:hypothetical protein